MTESRQNPAGPVIAWLVNLAFGSLVVRMMVFRIIILMMMVVVRMITGLMRMPHFRTMGMRHADMVMIMMMRMLAMGMGMGIVNMFMKMFVAVIMHMQMDMFMVVRPMGMAVGMEKLGNDFTVFIIHILGIEDAMQQFMGHQRQRHLQHVLFEQFAVIQYLPGRPVGYDLAVSQQQTAVTDFQCNIQIVST